MTTLFLIWAHKLVDSFSAIQKKYVSCHNGSMSNFESIADISGYLVDNIKQTEKNIFFLQKICTWLPFGTMSSVAIHHSNHQNLSSSSGVQSHCKVVIKSSSDCSWELILSFLVCLSNGNIGQLDLCFWLVFTKGGCLFFLCLQAMDSLCSMLKLPGEFSAVDTWNANAISLVTFKNLLLWKKWNI